MQMSIFLYPVICPEVKVVCIRDVLENNTGVGGGILEWLSVWWSLKSTHVVVAFHSWVNNICRVNRVILSSRPLTLSWVDSFRSNVRLQEAGVMPLAMLTTVGVQFPQGICKVVPAAKVSWWQSYLSPAQELLALQLCAQGIGQVTCHSRAKWVLLIILLFQKKNTVRKKRRNVNRCLKLIFLKAFKILNL